jgi:hypothetical protein
VEVIELPGDVVDAAEDEEPALEIVGGVSVPDCREFSFILQPREFEVSQAKRPDVVEPVAIILSSEEVEIVVVGGHVAVGSRAGNICIINQVLELPVVEPSKRMLILFLLMSYS